jgi:hypothetical protein
MSDGVPLIQLEAGGTAPVLRYDIPEPTSYEGKNFVELGFDDDVFLPVADEMPTAEATKELLKLPVDALKTEVEKFVATGVSEHPTLRAVPTNVLLGSPGKLGLVGAVAGTRAVVLAGPAPGTTSRGPDLPQPQPLPGPSDTSFVVDGILAGYLKGRYWVKTVGVDGKPSVTDVPVAKEPDPHLYLVETFRLSSFLGDYGAGRIVKTFSLLPGERTRISVRTFLQKETTRKEASSVLDSLTTESANDLETSVTREQSDQRSYKKTQEYYADAEASASWGWGKAKVKAGVKGSTSAAREESVKNVASATEKHSARASAKRQVEINTSYEETAKTEEELAIERDIENINLSRTINFVFRQMNQKFVTAVHLTDVRVAFFNGDRASRREVPLARLDDLLEEVVKPEKRADVRGIVLEQLSAVRGHDGTPVNLVREIQIGQDDSYIQFDSTLTSEIHDGQGRSYGEVPGLLLHQDELVMRTEGVIVESLLGQGDALDSYATELQQLEVQRRRAEVDLEPGRTAQLNLVNDAIANGDEEAVARAEKLACRCPWRHGHDQRGEAPPGPSPTPRPPGGGDGGG